MVVVGAGGGQDLLVPDGVQKGLIGTDRVKQMAHFYIVHNCTDNFDGQGLKVIPMVMDDRIWMVNHAYEGLQVQHQFPL